MNTAIPLYKWFILVGILVIPFESAKAMRRLAPLESRPKLSSRTLPGLRENTASIRSSGRRRSTDSSSSSSSGSSDIVPSQPSHRHASQILTRSKALPPLSLPKLRPSSAESTHSSRSSSSRDSKVLDGDPFADRPSSAHSFSSASSNSSAENDPRNGAAQEYPAFGAPRKPALSPLLPGLTRQQTHEVTRGDLPPARVQEEAIRPDGTSVYGKGKTLGKPTKEQGNQIRTNNERLQRFRQNRLEEEGASQAPASTGPNSK